MLYLLCLRSLFNTVLLQVLTGFLRVYYLNDSILGLSLWYYPLVCATYDPSASIFLWLLGWLLIPRSGLVWYCIWPKDSTYYSQAFINEYLQSLNYICILFDISQFSPPYRSEEFIQAFKILIFVCCENGESMMDPR